MIRILVAEDFDLLREDLCDTLSQQQDMEVAGCASSGRDIEAMALSTPADLILMDIEMETNHCRHPGHRAYPRKAPETEGDLPYRP